MSTRRQEALDYHAQGRPGKIQVTPTKPFKDQRDLSLAYTPGVARVSQGRTELIDPDGDERVGPAEGQSEHRSNRVALSERVTARSRVLGRPRLHRR